MDTSANHFCSPFSINCSPGSKRVDPCNCSSYFECLPGGLITRRRCPQGAVLNANRMSCDYPWANGSCQERQPWKICSESEINLSEIKTSEDCRQVWPTDIKQWEQTISRWRLNHLTTTVVDTTPTTGADTTKSLPCDPSTVTSPVTRTGSPSQSAVFPVVVTTVLALIAVIGLLLLWRKTPVTKKPIFPCCVQNQNKTKTMVNQEYDTRWIPIGPATREGESHYQEIPVTIDLGRRPLPMVPPSLLRETFLRQTTEPTQERQGKQLRSEGISRKGNTFPGSDNADGISGLFEPKSLPSRSRDVIGVMTVGGLYSERSRTGQVHSMAGTCAGSKAVSRPPLLTSDGKFTCVLNTLGSRDAEGERESAGYSTIPHAPSDGNPRCSVAGFSGKTSLERGKGRDSARENSSGEDGKSASSTETQYYELWSVGPLRGFVNGDLQTSL